MCNIKQRRAQNRRAQEPEENRGGNEIVRHVLAAHLSQPLPEDPEALPQLDGEVRVTRQYPAPGELNGSPEVLLLLVKRGNGGDLQRIDLAVATLDSTAYHGAQSFL